MVLRSLKNKSLTPDEVPMSTSLDKKNQVARLLRLERALRLDQTSLLVTHHISTTDQVTHIFTKPISEAAHIYFRDKLCLQP